MSLPSPLRQFARQSLAVLSIALLALPASAQPVVGEPAPDFTLPASDGETYRLADYVGKQAVVLAWFPRAFTSGCTIECKSLAENGHLIREYDVQYFMASVDPLEKNREFAEDTGADFPLLSDEEKDAARAYGVLSPLGFAKRHTVYIGADGTVLKVDTDINPETAAQDMAATLGELGVARGSDS